LEWFIRKAGDNIITGGFIAPVSEKTSVVVIVVVGGGEVVEEVLLYEVLVSNESVSGFRDALQSQQRNNWQP
jgi:hypothetical protein